MKIIEISLQTEKELNLYLKKMSSRALRKLQQEKDAKELELGGSDDEVSIVRPVTGARARRPNPFDLVSFSKLNLKKEKKHVK